MASRLLHIAIIPGYNALYRTAHIPHRIIIIIEFL